MEAPLLKKISETRDVKTFRFKIDMTFKPGQFVMLKVSERSEAFSISSSPTDKGYIDISMKMTTSEYKKTLEAAKIGDVFDIKGPYGTFLLNESMDAIMIAGGIGITPFRSMIRYAAAKRLHIKITLIYSSKTPEDIAFRKEIEELEKQNKNLIVIHTITRPEESIERWRGRTGRIDKEMIVGMKNWKGSAFYVCGPPAMVDSVVSLLKEAGVPQIKTEKFGGY
ncbi:MAG: FAD-binding oxidoreductase [Candidatus Aenigmarchaeota archaeon]|nr:FAD-binding oxidoreductase [Candidatus Aenigmarchaeota archaeon]